MALIEVRDYHFAPDRMGDYRTWAVEAGEYLRSRWDVSGFWLDSGVPTRIMGADPMELRHGHANVTWVIRWPDIDARERAWEALWEDPEWNDLWERHPGFNGYLHMSVRFLEEV